MDEDLIVVKVAAAGPTWARVAEASRQIQSVLTARGLILAPKGPGLSLVWVGYEGGDWVFGYRPGTWDCVPAGGKRGMSG